jgi:hypothetical protein
MTEKMSDGVLVMLKWRGTTCDININVTDGPVAAFVTTACGNFFL